MKNLIKSENMKNSPKDICPLRRVEEQEEEARRFGFYWDNIEQLIEQVHSECSEVQEAWKKKNFSHLQEEIGDLIQAAVSVAVFCNLDPQETLMRSVDKFQKRYDLLVELVKNDGHADLNQHSFKSMMAYWESAKKKTDQSDE